MSDSKAMLSEAEGVDPFAPKLPTVVCPRCGETFMRPEDRDIHLERHKPAPELSKEERVGKVHCPKGCGRWMVLDSPDGHAHVVLCDGSAPIPEERAKSAYRWWCEEHQYGTNGPMPWGVHKKEHHKGQEPVGRVPVDKKKERQVAVVPEVLKMLRAEQARLMIEKSKIEGQVNRISAAVKALEADLKSGE